VRRLLKFLHTLGAIGLMGTMATFLVALILWPTVTDAAAQGAVVNALAAIATWILIPAMGLTLLAGLLAIAITPAFHDAGWVWVKAATGISIFEGSFLYVAGPVQEAARNFAAHHLDALALAKTFGSERSTLWVLLAVAMVNVALGVWRPKMPQYPV
jgi:hypothetical protein